MFEMIKHPYNNKSIARLDLNKIVHNHLYHNCPIGKVSANLVYDNYNNVVGKIKSTKSSSPYLAGASYLLLIHENR